LPGNDCFSEASVLSGLSAIAIGQLNFVDIFLGDRYLGGNPFWYELISDLDMEQNN
jgi:hypothetical protein